MTIYLVINWFFAFSFFGYLLECTVLSYENKKPILNRGFGHGPFCIIYGFGALGGCLILQPIAGDPLRLYVASLLMATFMEMFTAHAMIKLFGSFWWDYSRKPFNYKGMICLESSLAWGFLGIFFFGFLNQFVIGIVSRIPVGIDRILALSLMAFYIADFIYTLRGQLRETDEDDQDQIVGRLKVL